MERKKRKSSVKLSSESLNSPIQDEIETTKVVHKKRRVDHGKSSQSTSTNTPEQRTLQFDTVDATNPVKADRILARTASGRDDTKSTSVVASSSSSAFNSPGNASMDTLPGDLASPRLTKTASLRIDIPAVKSTPFDLVIQTPVSTSGFKSTDLHTAVAEVNMQGIHEALQSVAADDEHLRRVHPSMKHIPTPAASKLLNARDEHGYTALMTAVTLEDDAVALEVCTLLITAGANCRLADRDGYTALHWAAACGKAQVSRLLVSHGNALIDARDNEGETPLHRCCRLGYVECVAALLELGADRLIRNQVFLSPLEVMGLYGGTRTPATRQLVRKTIYAHDPSCRTLILEHADSLEHATKQGHQEAAQRVTAIMTKAKHVFSTQEVDFVNDFPIGTLKLVSCAHSQKYIHLVMKLTSLSSSSGTPVPFTPYIQRTLRGVDADQLKKEENCDTSFSRGSLKAALRAVGAVTFAVDSVLQNKHRNAFCCVRPPGHHAGISGLLKDAVSCGFCIFNTVAIGAIYALGLDLSMEQKSVETGQRFMQPPELLLSPSATNPSSQSMTALARQRTPFSPPSLTSVPPPGVSLSSSPRFTRALSTPGAIGRRSSSSSSSSKPADMKQAAGSLAPILTGGEHKDSDHGNASNKSGGDHSGGNHNFPMPSPTPRTPRRINPFNTGGNKQPAPLGFPGLAAYPPALQQNLSMLPSANNNSVLPHGNTQRVFAKRVAIVDFDIHHGNGTQEIVKALNVPDRLFFFSIHLYDKPPHDDSYEFYPGSGDTHDIASNCINVPLKPLWAKPRSSPRHPKPQYEDGDKPKYGRMLFRDRIESVLLPALRAFGPDLILVSAGFDGMKADVGNQRSTDATRGMDLLPQDYYWLTGRLLDVANMTCNGRVVSVLEGGYGCAQTIKPSTPFSPDSGDRHVTRSSTKSQSPSPSGHETRRSTSRGSNNTPISSPAEDVKKRDNESSPTKSTSRNQTKSDSVSSSDDDVMRKQTPDATTAAAAAASTPVPALDTSVLVNACIAHMGALLHHPKHGATAKDDK